MKNQLEHHFRVEDAKKYGINKAVLLYNLSFWLDKNKANQKHIHKHTNGKKYCWTYNSGKAFKELFPYMSEKSITRWLTELEQDGVIISGNFNKHRYDRTKWYSLLKMGYSITQNEECFTQNEECFTQNDRPIPDNKPDNKHREREEISISRGTPKKILKKETEKIIDNYRKCISSGKFYCTAGARPLVSERIKEFGAVELLKAIKGFSEKKNAEGKLWHLENNGGNGVEWFFESQKRLVQYIGFYEQDLRKKLGTNIHPAERLDIDNFEQKAKEYLEEEL